MSDDLYTVLKEKYAPYANNCYVKGVLGFLQETNIGMYPRLDNFSPQDYTQKDDCFLCEGESEIYPDGLNAKDLKIFDTSLFRGIVDVSPISAGHILLAYKVHKTASSQLEPEAIDELMQTINVLRSFNKDVHGLKTEFFEHGTFDCHGSCVDHTHMHAVATEQSASDLVKSKLCYQQINDIGVVSRIPGLQTYFMFIDEHGEIIIDIDNIVPSQFGRQVYGAINGNFQTNWRTNLSQHPEKLLAQVDAVRQHYGGLESYIQQNQIKGFYFPTHSQSLSTDCTLQPCRFGTKSQS